MRGPGKTLGDDRYDQRTMARLRSVGYVDLFSLAGENRRQLRFSPLHHSEVCLYDFSSSQLDGSDECMAAQKPKGVTADRRGVKGSRLRQGALCGENGRWRGNRED